MAHNLTINKMTGATEMFYVGEAPWHGLGTRLDGVATSGEAIAAAGLGWWVEKRALMISTPGGLKEVEGHKATVRSDTHEVLGVVSDDYQVVQNLEAFQFADALVGESAAMFHTAGSTHGGKRVWALIKLPTSLVVVPDDVVDQYLMLYTGHDGGRGLTSLFTPVRVVCDNTVRAALSTYENADGSKRDDAPAHYYTIRHMGDVKAQMAEAQRVLGVARRYFEVVGETYRAMSAKQLNDAMLQGYLKVVMPDPVDAFDEQIEVGTAKFLAEQRCKRASGIREKMAFLFTEGRGNQLPAVRGTLWAAFNAATEWVDHVNVLRKDGEPKVHGFESAMFGTGEDVRQRAFDAAVALL